MSHTVNNTLQHPPLIPTHVAIIMDGNGRWAKQRKLPRFEGHRKATDAVRAAISAAIAAEVPILTLFAFSSENWKRPKAEVDFLFMLLQQSLQKELKSLFEHGVCIKIIGDRTPLSLTLQKILTNAETTTQHNTRLRLNIAINYGGKWDMLSAAKQLATRVQNNELTIDQITEQTFVEGLSLGTLPEVDLLIRTSGEYRLSNFMLWQLAYSELLFLDLYWPEFRESHFREALHIYSTRQRRFGRTGEQVAS